MNGVFLEPSRPEWVATLIPLIFNRQGKHVEADFDKGAGDRVIATFSMILEQSAWQIDDISYRRSDGSTDTLRDELKGR
jgi:hypothetical protein